MSAPQLATGLDHLRRNIAAVLQNVDDRTDPFGKAVFQAGMRQHKPKSSRQAGPNGLEIVLEGQVIRQIELANACRIAGTPEIFQEQSIVEVAEFCFR